MSVAGSEEEKDSVSADAPSSEVESDETATPETAEAAIEPGVLETADGDVSAEEEDLASQPIEPTLEAILFAAAEPIPLQRLSRLFQGRGRGVVKEALDRLKATFEESGRGIRLVEVSSGFQLRSAPEHAPWLRRFFAEKPPRLSRALLETVAIIAYRQPVSRGEIEAIRGVNCDAILTALLNRDLVLSTGRRDTPGRPVEYGTTAEFLELFTMKNLGELPPLPDAESLANLLKETPAEEAGEDSSGDAAADDGGSGSGYGADAAEDASPEQEEGIGSDSEQEVGAVAGDADAEEEAEPRGAAMATAAGAVGGQVTVLADASDPTINLMPALLEAVRARTTVGEIVEALEGVFGTYV
ncbi:MAG: SMC-Scp complex subunit ScpB, partial [bacterium]